MFSAKMYFGDLVAHQHYHLRRLSNEHYHAVPHNQPYWGSEAHGLTPAQPLHLQHLSPLIQSVLFNSVTPSAPSTVGPTASTQTSTIMATSMDYTSQPPNSNGTLCFTRLWDWPSRRFLSVQIKEKYCFLCPSLPSIVTSISLPQTWMEPLCHILQWAWQVKLIQEKC